MPGQHLGDRLAEVRVRDSKASGNIALRFTRDEHEWRLADVVDYQD